MGQIIQTHIQDTLFISRCHYGIKLVKEAPRQPLSHPLCKVADIMKLPMNFYFTDTESTIKFINEKTAITCGYQSEKDAVGKSVRDIAIKKTANTILHNDKEVVRTRRPKIIEEHFIRFDEADLVAVSIKFPWLNQDNKVIGIFGCSILLGYPGSNSLANSLTFLMQTGLLNSTHRSQALSGLSISNICFSKREADILSLYVRGKTAKTIADILGLSHRTIEHHLERAKIKLGASTKSELIEKIFDRFK